jgi:LysM repeat protein
MEGGMMPWREQKVVNLSPDLDYFSKSLPPPPSGHFWERQDNGEWVLFRMPYNESVGINTMEFSKPSIFEHTIMPTDTLQGICLRYRVSATVLRRMNMFSGNNIHFKKSLLIPVQGGCLIEFQQVTTEVVLQKFRNATQENAAECRLYLDEHNWNLEAALAAWRNDESWAKDNEKECAEIPSVPMMDIPDEDDEIEDESLYGTVAPAAVEAVPVTIPAFVSSVFPSLGSVMNVVDIEMSTVESDSKKVPLLA